MQIPSHGRARYFVVFKNNNNSYRFVFIIQQYNDVYDFFKLFYVFSFNESGRDNTKLRSNNAKSTKEYLSTSFQAFIKKKGIRHSDMILLLFMLMNRILLLIEIIGILWNVPNPCFIISIWACLSGQKLLVQRLIF